MRIEQLAVNHAVHGGGLPNPGRPASASTGAQPDTAALPARQTAEDLGQLEQAIQAVKEFVSPVAQTIEFSIDGNTGRTIVKMVDTSTREVVRQMPSEEMLAIAKSLSKLQGLLVDQVV